MNAPVGVLLLLLSAAIIAANYALAIRYCATHVRGSSIPIIGGGFGAIGLLLLGAAFSRWWFMPMIVDLGGVPAILMAVAVRMRK